MRAFRAVLLLSAVLLACLPVGSSGAAGRDLRGHDCTITGTEGPDTITGTTGDDVICGLGGRDVIHARSGADTVYGGTGNDNIFGGGGDDLLYGGGDRDLVRGLGGDDRIFGGPASDFPLTGDFGSDVVNGGPGNDVCVSGLDEVEGNDTVIGGPGIDHYEIDAGDAHSSAEILGLLHRRVAAASPLRFVVSAPTRILGPMGRHGGFFRPPMAEEDKRPITRTTIRRVVSIFRPYRRKVSVVGVAIVALLGVGRREPADDQEDLRRRPVRSQLRPRAQAHARDWYVPTCTRSGSSWGSWS